MMCVHMNNKGVIVIGWVQKLRTKNGDSIQHHHHRHHHPLPQQLRHNLKQKKEKSMWKANYDELITCWRISFFHSPAPKVIVRLACVTRRTAYASIILSCAFSSSLLFSLSFLFTLIRRTHTCIHVFIAITFLFSFTIIIAPLQYICVCMWMWFFLSSRQVDAFTHIKNK